MAFAFSLKAVLWPSRYRNPDCKSFGIHCVYIACRMAIQTVDKSGTELVRYRSSHHGETDMNRLTKLVATPAEERGVPIRVAKAIF